MTNETIASYTGDVRSALDEGGTHHGGGDQPFRAAVMEAEERARRMFNVSDREIGRSGYTLEDYENAKRRSGPA